MTDVNAVCDVEAAGGTGSVVCSANLTFLCLVVHQRLGVTLFRPHP